MIEPMEWDIAALLWLNGHGGEAMDWLMHWVSDKFVWVPLYILGLWGVFKTDGWRGVALFLVVMALAITCADQTATLAKAHLPKLRPSHNPALEGLLHTGVNGYRGGLYGTISSHAANSLVVMILFCGVLRRRWLWWAGGVWVMVVCYSRIYLGVHYPLDILLGLLEGAIWATLGLLIYRKLRGVLRIPVI